MFTILGGIGGAAIGVAKASRQLEQDLAEGRPAVSKKGSYGVMGAVIGLASGAAADLLVVLGLAAAGIKLGEKVLGSLQIQTSL